MTMDMQSNRRGFFQQAGLNLGAVGLSSLLAGDLTAQTPDRQRTPHFAPRAKAVIFMFMAGGPSQLELFDYKPKLAELSGQTPPESFMKDRRFAFLKGTEKLLGPRRKFERHGESDVTLSDLLPHHREIADEVCWLQGMTTDVFNHGPAKVFMQSGSPQPGRPSMGS
ncbi:MAG TPA: sulfatase, partial [Planctomycetaceae bacterium]|nr:sulfatase [Planctomycetaceae bacterium]